MDFNTITYIIFLIISVPIYWLAKYLKIRQVLILFFSIIFYSFWNISFLSLIFFSVLINYYFPLKINGSDAKTKKVYLCLGIILNLSMLLFFKYTNFILENAYILGDVMTKGMRHTSFDIILPMGISFFTFRGISYIVDVYRGYQKPSSNFVLVANYIIFFPYMIAGPIARASEMFNQMEEMKKFKQEYINKGISLIISGLVLKVVFADNIAEYVDSAFKLDPSKLSFIDCWTFAYSFGFQIYFDFAGYSLVALGSACLFGYVLPGNFFYPYMVTNVREFWKRWHISLSSWIRDYLYIPLTGSKVSMDKSHGGIEMLSTSALWSLFLTWALMGLWHGASWNFLFWGLYHAFLVVMYRLYKKYLSEKIKMKSYSILPWIITICFVMAGWVFFKAQSLPFAFIMLKTMFNVFNISFTLQMRQTFYIVIFMYLVLMIISFYVYKIRETIMKSKIYPALVFTYSTMCFILLILELNKKVQFIYFQF